LGSELEILSKRISHPFSLRNLRQAGSKQKAGNEEEEEEEDSAFFCAAKNSRNFPISVLLGSWFAFKEIAEEEKYFHATQGLPFVVLRCLLGSARLFVRGKRR